MRANTQNVYQLEDVKNLSELICEKITELIFQGYIKPGERLVQTDLAERFSVSRITIRDAFHLLVQTGLVERNDAGGLVVKSLSRKDIENIASLRQLIEPHIASIACNNIGDDGVARLDQVIIYQKRLLESEDYIGYLKADWIFHKTLYVFSGNDLAVSFMEELWNRICQARGMIFINDEWGRSWVERSIKGHEIMVQAVKKKDSEELVRIVKDNINSAQKEQLQWFDLIANRE